MSLPIRCNICDAVPNKSFLNGMNHVCKGSFHDDPNGEGGFLCEDCYSGYTMVSLEFMMEDETNLAWKNFSLRPKRKK